MGKFSHFILLCVALAWITLSFYSVYAPFGPIGKILSYPNGIFSRQIPDQNIEFSGTGVDCKISLDAYGVPTIEAKKAEDVAFGVGFMQARDRYFQMELITRAVQGRLSELMGDLVLKKDIFWRPLNADSLARNDLKSLQTSKPDVYNYIMAYNKGVRFYLDQEGRKERFFEYSLLCEKPRDWEDHYPLLLSYYMSEMLAYDRMGAVWDNNLNKMSQRTYDLFFNPALTPAYEHVYPDTFKAKIYEPVIAADTILDSLEAFDGTAHQDRLGIGSNNWAISKGKSKSGKAILCNDTHLNISLPNPWYQVHLICDDFHVQGFSIPCVPYVLSGNNDYIAWGITNGYWDEVDLFKLKISDDSSGYIVDGKEKPFKIVEHVIEVKGKDDYVLKSKYSVHGIVKSSKNGLYAEKWYALDFESSIHAFDKIMRSKNWNGFREGLRNFTFPPQNFAYADVNGNVGMISAGKMPAKPASYRGEMLDGSISFEPQFLAFEELPQRFSGDSGYVSSANQMQGASNYFINYFWGEPYRGERINQFLESKPQLIADDMKILHLDKIDLAAKKTIALYDSVELNKSADTWMGELRAWNGEMNPILKTPVKYQILHQSINKTVRDLLEKEGVKWWADYYRILDVLAKDTIVMNGKTLASKNLLSSALDSAIVYYKAEVNDSLTYGDISPFYAKHILQLPGLGRKIEAKGGGGFTVDVNSGGGKHGASMRTIIEMGNQPGVQTILAGGQSGRVNSIHYADQLEMWKSGAYNQVKFEKGEKRSVNFVFKAN